MNKIHKNNFYGKTGRFQLCKGNALSSPASLTDNFNLILNLHVLHPCFLNFCVFKIKCENTLYSLTSFRVRYCVGAHSLNEWKHSDLKVGHSAPSLEPTICNEVSTHL